MTLQESEKYVKEKGGVVHVHFEPNDDTYIRQDDVYRLMTEYAQSCAQEAREENEKLKENDLYLRKLNSDLTKQLADSLELSKEAREKAMFTVEDMSEFAYQILQHASMNMWDKWTREDIKEVLEKFLLNLKEKK